MGEIMSTDLCTNVQYLERIMQIIGDRIREIRRKEGAIQTRFAAKYGISQRALNYVESGERMPNAEFLYSLRQKNIDLNSLFASIDANLDEKEAIHAVPEQSLLAKKLADLLQVSVSEDDIDVLAAYCTASDTVKVIIQSVLRAGIADSSK